MLVTLFDGGELQSNKDQTFQTATATPGWASPFQGELAEDLAYLRMVRVDMFGSLLYK